MKMRPLLAIIACLVLSFGHADARSGGARLRLSGGSMSAPTPPGSNFITSTTAGTAQSDDGLLYRGFYLIVGSAPLTVSALCQYVGTTHSGVHTFGMFTRDPVTSNGVLMFGTAVTVDLTAATPGTYACTSLSTNVVLWPGTSYWFGSRQTTGTGDTWYNNDTVVTTTADAILEGSATIDPTTGSLGNTAMTNHPFVPVDFKYTVGTPGANVTQLGTVYTNVNPGAPSFVNNNFEATNVPREASGSQVLANGVWFRGPSPPETLTYQYRIWGSSGSIEMTSPVLSETMTGPNSGHGPLIVTASISGPTMTVTFAAGSTIAIGQNVTGANVLPGTVISNLGSGTGGVGTYTVSPSQTVSPETMTVQGGDNSLPWVFDSTALTDGTKVIYPRILDSSTRSVGDWFVLARTFLVNNGTHNEGAQTLPIAIQSHQRWMSPRPDLFHYDGVPNPIHNAYAYPYIAAPSAGGSATYRPATNWYFGTPTGNHADEYHEYPQWSTTNSLHGVLMTGSNPLAEDSNTTPGGYNPVIKLNPSDGTRPNAIVSPFTNYLEDPVTSGKWWFVEINGRVGTIGRDGTVTTVVGFRRNKSNLTIIQDDADPNLQESTNTQTIGTFPPGVDCGGANDIIFDPRDGSHNTMYEVCQVDNWIGKINIATQTVTVYAGSPGAPGAYTGDGGSALSATFNSPNSIIMDGSGNMYVSDQANSAIRKIASSSLGVPGNITTVYGGTTWTGWAGHGSVPLSYHDMNTAAATYNVSTTSWNSGTQLLTTTMSGVPGGAILPGYQLQMSGATNSGGSGDPNIVWTVQAAGYTDSNHFVLGFPQSQRPRPSTIGTLTGTITLSSNGADVYSSPTSVPTTSTGGQVLQPGAIQFTSNGNIIVIESITSAARLINLNTLDGGTVGNIERVGSNDGEIIVDQEPQWMWGDVDLTGAEGPVNDIFLWKFQCCLNGASATWRISLAHDSIGQPSYSNVMFDDLSVLPTWGPNETIRQGAGHYPWGVALSRSEGKIISTGIAQMGPILAQIISDPTGLQPPVNQFTSTNFNQAEYNLGLTNHVLGTTSGFPGDVRPSFWSIYGPFGIGYIGNTAGTSNTDTFEDLMHGSFASTTPGDTGDQNLAAFIQGGMGGHIPRPEFSSNGFGFGNDLRNFIYFIRRGTLQGGAQPTPVPPGPTNTDNAPPMILTLSINRTSTTAIQAIFTTDKSTICLLAGASMVQNGLGYYPLFSDLDSFGTSHNITLTVPVAAVISPVFTTALCQDQGGNFSHSTPQSIP